MPKKTMKSLKDKKIQIVSIFGVIPVMKIVHKWEAIEYEKAKFIRYAKMYWLFGFIPLLMTERD